MKPPLVYTLVAEGYAEYSFIPVYLKRMAEEKGLQVKRSSLDLSKGQPSKSKVLSKAEELCLKAVEDENQQFCVVGVDLDGPDHTEDRENHRAECLKIIKSLATAHRKYGEKIILYVPVQAIEHWLYYQAYQTRSIARPNHNSVEKELPQKLKKALCGDRENRRQMQSVALAIAEKADFNELARQSRSFKHFHRQITDFLERETKMQ